VEGQEKKGNNKSIALLDENFSFSSYGNEIAQNSRLLVLLNRFVLLYQEHSIYMVFEFKSALSSTRWIANRQGEFVLDEVYYFFFRIGDCSVFDWTIIFEKVHLNLFTVLKSSR
jgi:hypothetical protein